MLGVKQSQELHNHFKVIFQFIQCEQGQKIVRQGYQ